jgi:hypothetical protein
MGVADFDSLGLRVIPWLPMCAVTGLPWRNQPPPDALLHACSVATVLPAERAVTVMTSVAEPVLYGSGSGCPVTVAGVGDGFGDGFGVTGVVVRGRGFGRAGVVAAARRVVGPG